MAKRSRSTKPPPLTEENKMIKVDHSKMGLVLAEPGFYGFKVLRTKKQKAKTSGATVAIVVSIITEADNKDMLGKQVLDNLPLMESTLWRVNGFYTACMGEALPEGDYSEQDLYDLIADTKDTTYHAEVIVDQYEGRDRNRLQNFSE